MNKVVNKFWLTGNKSISEMHLKQLGFTYSTYGTFTKNKERITQFMQAGNTNYIFKNDFDKDSFQQNMAYGKYKELLQEQNQINFPEINHLKLLVIQI